MKNWQKWMVWLCLSDYLGSKTWDMGVAIGLTTINYSKFTYGSIDVIFFIVSLIAFTVFTMNIKEL